MKGGRLAILVALSLGLCLAGAVMVVVSSPKRPAAVRLVLRGLQTNGVGRLCVLVCITNRNNSEYGITFATQTRSAQGWSAPSMTDPLLVPSFNTYGARQVRPRSEGEFLVPVSSTSTTWRVVAGYWELPPAKGMRKYSWIARAWFTPRRNYIRFLTAPELSSNEHSALDARTALCLHIEDPWPGASESERSARASL